MTTALNADRPHILRDVVLRNTIHYRRMTAIGGHRGLNGRDPGGALGWQVRKSMFVWLTETLERNIPNGFQVNAYMSEPDGEHFSTYQSAGKLTLFDALEEAWRVVVCVRNVRTLVQFSEICGTSFRMTKCADGSSIDARSILQVVNR